MLRFPKKLEIYNERNFESMPQISKLTNEQRHAIKVVSKVLPFRVNNYVLENLIDWDNIPNDPIFQLTFPQKGMLTSERFAKIAQLINANDSKSLKNEIYNTRLSLNPHPAGQLSLNKPMMNGKFLEGLQHKYDETLLFFPASGQTCHSYCTFCFRWAQFVGEKDLIFSAKQATMLTEYLKNHPEVSDILITGGDPLIAKTQKIRVYVEEILKIPTIKNIRIGTKALTYWPQRFVTDSDASDLLMLFDQVVSSGKHLAIMAHYNHPSEITTSLSYKAIKAILNTGAVIRSQSPIVEHINNDPNVWQNLWEKQVSLGIVPYYMFVERDTGADEYFKVSLSRALTVFKEAYKSVSGLARTVRGPSMSTSPGKVLVEDVVSVNGNKFFAMKFLQARNKDLVGKLFFIPYDRDVCWYDNLDLKVPMFNRALSSCEIETVL